MNQPCTLPYNLTAGMPNDRLRGQLFTLLHLRERGITVEEFCSVLRGFTMPGQTEMVKEPRSVKLKD